MVMRASGRVIFQACKLLESSIKKEVTVSLTESLLAWVNHLQDSDKKFRHPLKLPKTNTMMYSTFSIKELLEEHHMSIIMVRV